MNSASIRLCVQLARREPSSLVEPDGRRSPTATTSWSWSRRSSPPSAIASRSAVRPTASRPIESRRLSKTRGCLTGIDLRHRVSTESANAMSACVASQKDTNGSRVDGDIEKTEASEEHFTTGYQITLSSMNADQADALFDEASEGHERPIVTMAATRSP